VEELVKIFYSKGVKKERLAVFSKNVIEVASKGDLLAIDVVNSACETLSRMVQVLLKRLSFDRPRLVLSGGVFEGSKWFRKRFTESLHADVETVNPVLTPVTGAFMLALSSCGLKLAPEVFDNIKQSEKNALGLENSKSQG
jgi:N-acetylglucosamine kinase-like BadF-type ATPase